MPTTLEILYPDGSKTPIEYILPGVSATFFTEGDDGKINRSVIVACQQDDYSAEIFECPDTSQIPKTGREQYFDSLRTNDNFIKRVDCDQQETFPMYDVDNGHFDLVMSHTVILAAN